MGRLDREREYWNTELEARKAPEKFYSVMREYDRVSEGMMLPFATPENRVLELGCHEAKFALDFFAARGTEIVGIDVADAPIERAREEAKRRGLADVARFEVGDAHNLAYDDSSFDYVYATGVLHHLEIPKAMREVRRVLKPDGAAMFFEPLGGNPLINAYRALTPKSRTPDERPLTQRDLELLGEGWASVEIRYFHLTSLAAVPLRRTPVFDRLIGGLQATDRALFRAPPLRRLAWYSIISLTGPEKPG